MKKCKLVQNIMNFKFCYIIFCTIICFIVLSVPTFAKENSDNVIRVGSFEETYNTVNEKGERSGYGYEYLQDIAGYAGWTYKYITSDWKNCFTQLENGEIDILGGISYTDERAENMLFSDMPMGEEILSHIEDVEQAGDIVDLLKYDEDTAGGLMGTEMIVVNENWSMPKCIDEMRKQAEDMDEIYYVYVVDDDERLRGVLPLQKLITNPSVSKIKHVMKKDPISVRDSDSIEEVTETIEKYDLVALPVIDSIGRLVGRITIDDVMDEVREQHERDYQLASGISQDVETSDNVFTQTAARLPWLLIGMIGGIGNSLILGNFEGNFAVNPKMALFIPLIGGTGGNVGIQSSAIVVQGLANNSLKEGNILPQILKESVVSLINASIISLVVFIYNFFMLGDRGITASVSLSLFAVVMFASVFGTLVPMTLDKLKIDPALATGPFITITNDIIGMMIYMFITSALAG